MVADQVARGEGRMKSGGASLFTEYSMTALEWP